MTYQTLSLIHNLLVNKEHELSSKVEVLRKEFYDAEHLYDQELISRSEYDSAETKYNDVYKAHRQVSDALREFEGKEWK